MKKGLLFVIVLMALIVSSVAHAAPPTCSTLPESEWGSPHYRQVCAAKGGQVKCRDASDGPRFYCTVPVYYNDLFGKPYELPGKPADLLEILEGETAGVYTESINVPEGIVRVFFTKTNKVEPYWNHDFQGWSANLVDLEYGISKECFGEAIAERAMKYRITHALAQDDGQYWKKFSNANPIITNCNLEEGVVEEEQLLDNLSTLQIERISSSQGDPWAFKPIFDEDGNIVGPSPKLGFELK